MSPLEHVFFWSTVFLYAGATVVSLINHIMRIGWGRRLLSYLLLLGLLANVLVLVVGVWEAGFYWPVKTVFLAGLLIVLLVVGVRHWFPEMSFITPLAMSAALLTLGAGFVSYVTSETDPTTLAFRSYWLFIHVLFALLAYACFVIATVGSIVLILRKRLPHRLPAALTDRVNVDNELLDEFNFRFVFLGFAADTIMILSGTLWAKMLWGNFWAWDPIETWSLISWLSYGAYVHLRLTLGWRGEGLAWICLVALVINIISIWAVGIVTPDTYHTYEFMFRRVSE